MHISQLSGSYVKHPMDVVSVGDNVTVWVMGVDLKKGRVSLTMRPPQGNDGGVK
ncbi:General stress protein 13 [compost metagenome]